MSGAADPLCITGLGTINAIGADVATFWTRLVAGASGIAPLDSALAGETGMRAAAVTGSVAPRRPVARLSRTDALAMVAAEEAVAMAGFPGPVDPRRVAVVVGSTCGGFREIEKYYLDRAAGRPVSSSRLMALEKANAADRLAARFGFLGPRLAVHTACASGATALLVGAELIRDGAADAALAGGSDALARLTLSGFRALRLVDPDACRPFDRARRGLSLGEGAGMLVIEPAATAARRGARPLAVLRGGAHTADAHHLTAPAADGSGATRAIRAALAEAGLAPADIDHINAHGTGTAANDAAEAASIAAALGTHAASCPVTSIKGSLGHTLGAAGAIEAIATIQTLRTGLVPPTVGLREPDPSFDLDLVIGAPRRGAYRAALSHSFGFGGANAVLCFGRAEA